MFNLLLKNNIFILSNQLIMKIRFFLWMGIFVLLSACTDKKTGIPENDILVAAYLPHWGIDNADMTVLPYLDHLYYFSIAPDQQGEFFIPEGMTEDIELIKTYTEGTETLLFLVLGGWYESETIFTMFEDPSLRQDYVDRLTSFCLDNGINGVDLDWESYPLTVRPQDHSVLINMLSQSLRANGLLFSIAMAPSNATFSASVSNLVDYINVMSYGFFDDEGNQVPLWMFKDYTNLHLDAGIPRDKLIMGVPFYAKRPYAEGDDSPRTYTYASIVDMAYPPPASNNYGRYSFNGRYLIKDKTSFLIENSIGGIMAWELSQDVDLSSPYSLMDAILEEAGKK